MFMRTPVGTATLVLLALAPLGCTATPPPLIAPEILTAASSTLEIEITVDPTTTPPISVVPVSGLQGGGASICWDNRQRNAPADGGECQGKYNWKLAWTVSFANVECGDNNVNCFVTISSKDTKRKNGNMFPRGKSDLPQGTWFQGKPRPTRGSVKWKGGSNKSRVFEYQVTAWNGDTLISFLDPDILVHGYP